MGSGKGSSRLNAISAVDLMDEERDDVSQTYKNRMMVHDIHRVRELSALLEERRRYFDGQLGEVYRNAGVSSPNTSLPRLRSLDSPRVSPSPSNSHMTDNISLVGNNVGSIEIGSGCSARSYSVFADADDELSVADSFEYTDRVERLGKSGARRTRNWNSSTNPHGQSHSHSHLSRGNENSGVPFSDHRIYHPNQYQAMSASNIKDSIQNEVMRTADLEKKLKARRSSLPLALEASLKRPLKKKGPAKNNVSKNNSNNSTLPLHYGPGSRRDRDREMDGVMNLLNMTTLLAQSHVHGYPDSSDAEELPFNLSRSELLKSRSRKFSMPATSTTRLSNNNKISWDSSHRIVESSEIPPAPSNFSMSQTLKKTRKYDLNQDHKKNLELANSTLIRQGQRSKSSNNHQNNSSSKNNLNNVPSVDNDLQSGRDKTKLGSKSMSMMGVCPPMPPPSAVTIPPPVVPLSSSSIQATYSPMADYSPRSSMSTNGNSYPPRIAFSSLEKLYREEGDKSSKVGQLHPSQLLLKPVPKIDMNLYNEPVHVEPDYSHDFRYLSLLDALVPVFERGRPWKTTVRPIT